MRKCFFSIGARCLWSKAFNHYPENLECILTYCDNATMDPNSSHNYNFIWDENVIPLEKNVQYFCQNDMKIENDTDTKVLASDHSKIKCGSDGDFFFLFSKIQ